MEVPGFFEALDEVMEKFILLAANKDQVVAELQRYVARVRKTVDMSTDGLRGLVIGLAEIKKDPAYLKGRDDFQEGIGLFEPPSFHDNVRGKTDAYLYAVGWMQARFELFKEGEYDANQKLIEIKQIIERPGRKVDWTRPGPNPFAATRGGDPGGSEPRGEEGGLDL